MALLACLSRCAPPVCGVASELSHSVQRLAFDHLDAPIIRINGTDTPVAYAPTLVAAYLPKVTEVVKAAKEILYINK